MHQKEAAKRRKRRVIFTNVLVVLTIVLLAGILVLYTMGYRLNRSLTLEQKGLLRVNSYPTAAQVLLNGTPSGRRTAARLELGEGNYLIGVSKAGYDLWERSVTMQAGSVVWLDYVLLLPQLITTEAVVNLPEENWSRLSGDRNTWLIAALGAPDHFTVVDLARNNVTELTHRIPLDPARNETLNLTLVDLSDDGMQAIIKREAVTTGTRPQNTKTKVSYYLVELASGKATELPLLAGRAWTEAKFADSFYLLDQSDNLWLYDGALENERHVAADVTRVQRYGAQLYLTTRAKDDGLYQAWLYEPNGDRRLLLSREQNFAWDLTVYMGDTYIVAADERELLAGKITEEERQVVAETGFSALPELLVSARMVVAASEGSFVSYDLETEQVTPYQPNLDWLGGWLAEGVLYGWQDGELVIVDFDGYNRRVGTAMREASPVAETAGHYLYYLIDGATTPELRRFRL